MQVKSISGMQLKVPFNNNNTATNRRMSFIVMGNGFPSFLPKQIHTIKDPFSINLAMRIERLPVKITSSGGSIMSSCIRPLTQGKTDPIVLLHGFDSSCLEWRRTFPLLEESGAECWAVDILGWGFSDLEKLPPCGVESKRNHLYQFWKSYIKRPMTLVGPSLGAAVAIDFAANYPETVSKLVLIDASVYSEGIGSVADLPPVITYAALELLKSAALRFYVNRLLFKGIPISTTFDWMNVSRLHCHMPWWKDATVSFMASGGYNVTSLIKQIRQRTLILWGEDDKIISYKVAVRLHSELPDAILRRISDCGHIPHVEKPDIVTKLILEFVHGNCYCDPKIHRSLHPACN